MRKNNHSKKNCDLQRERVNALAYEDKASWAQQCPLNDARPRWLSLGGKLDAIVIAFPHVVYPRPACIA